MPECPLVAIHAWNVRLGPKRTSGRPYRRAYFFKLDLLGGEPLWQVPHGLPFAIWGVACTLDIINEFIASARKKTNPAPLTLVTIPVLVTGCMSPSNLSARGNQ